MHPQIKPSKLKIACFVAAPDRHGDWLLDFGDVLVLDKGNTLYNPDVKTWLFPDLQGAGACTVWPLLAHVFGFSMECR